MATKTRVSFQLSKYEKSLLTLLTRHFECTQVELLRKWIQDESRQMMKPLADHLDAQSAAEREEIPTPARIRQMEAHAIMDEAGMLTESEEVQVTA